MFKSSAIIFALAFTLSACALKGSKAEERYEGTSNCSKPGFTCNDRSAGLDTGVQPVSPDEAQSMPSFNNEANKYAPLCRLKNDKCECSCQAVP